MGGQGLVPVAAGALAGALGAAPAMAIAGGATILAALALRRPLGRLRDHHICDSVSDYEREDAEPGLRRAAR
jgi:NaMN:DMB phosphoribosyltransferase